MDLSENQVEEFEGLLLRVSKNVRPDTELTHSLQQALELKKTKELVLAQQKLDEAHLLELRRQDEANFQASLVEAKAQKAHQLLKAEEDLKKVDEEVDVFCRPSGPPDLCLTQVNTHVLDRLVSSETTNHWCTRLAFRDSRLDDPLDGSLLGRLVLKCPLEDLDLENAQLGPQGLSDLCEGLRNHPTLKVLNLARNRLMGPGTQPSGLRDLGYALPARLHSLNLASNKVNDEVMQVFLESLESHDFICQVVLDGNPRVSEETLQKIRQICQENMDRLEIEWTTSEDEFSGAPLICEPDQVVQGWLAERTLKREALRRVQQEKEVQVDLIRQGRLKDMLMEQALARSVPATKKKKKGKKTK